MNRDDDREELAALERAQARADRALEDVDRLFEIAAQIPSAEIWRTGRGNDGALIVWSDGEPLAVVLGGIDVAKWIVATCPARLLGGSRS